jgi:hypothetical protein
MIRVQYHLESQDTEEISSKTEAFESTPLATDKHGFNVNGAIACCRRSSSIGLVDCSACLDESWDAICDTLDSKSCDVARELFTVLAQSEGQGIKKSDIIVRLFMFVLIQGLNDDVIRTRLPHLPLICLFF